MTGLPNPKQFLLPSEKKCKKTNKYHSARVKVQHYPWTVLFHFFFFVNQGLKTSSNPPPQSGSNLPPPTPRTSSYMMCALMSGWMAVSCPPRRSCMMPGWQKRAGDITTEPAHPGNHLLWNSSCERQSLLFTATPHPHPPSVTVCKPTCVTVNTLLTANWSLFSKCCSEKLRQCVQSFALFGFCPIQLDFFFTLEIPEIHGCNTALLTVPKSEGFFVYRPPPPSNRLHQIKSLNVLWLVAF